MRETLEIARSIAVTAHQGQLYGDGSDYIEGHVRPIAELIAKMGYGEDFQATGWLHDVIEDSDTTAQDLATEGIPLHIVSAVELLTKKPNQNSQLYLDGIAKNNLAIVAKFADSSINYANTVRRPAEIDEERFNRWTEKYAGNIAFLLPKMPAAA